MRKKHKKHKKNKESKKKSFIENSNVELPDSSGK